jgi:hypothetical protein
MQTIQFKVDNHYIEIVLNLLNSLNSLKLNVIKDLLIIDNKKSETDNDLESLDKLFQQSSNKIMVTKENAINTEEMIDDISRY